MIVYNDTSVSDWWKCLFKYFPHPLQGELCPVVEFFLVALLTPSFWRNLCQSGFVWYVFPNIWTILVAQCLSLNAKQILWQKAKLLFLHVVFEISNYFQKDIDSIEIKITSALSFHNIWTLSARATPVLEFMPDQIPRRIDYLYMQPTQHF